MFKAIFLVGLTIPLVTAAPQGDMMGYTYFCPTVDYDENVTGDPWQIGISGSGGSELTTTQSHTVGTTWTIGGGLGLSVGDITSVDGGLSASVSETIEDSMEESDTMTCPDGDWYCSVMIYPGMKLVKGHMKRMDSDDSCDAETKTNYDGVSDGDQYELTIPRKDSSGNGFFTARVCTCGNIDHWADKDHPELLCMEDCTAVDS